MHIPIGAYPLVGQGLSADLLLPREKQLGSDNLVSTLLRVLNLQLHSCGTTDIPDANGMSLRYCMPQICSPP